MENADKKNNLTWTSALLLLTAFLLYSFTGVFSKLASSESFLSWAYLSRFAIVILILGVYAVLWQIILKRMPLTQAYLFKSVTVIFSLVLASLFFKEKITLQNVLGAALIIAGIIVNSSERSL